MRFVSTTLIGFAGVADELTVDLDGGVILILGANGLGKTTLCDALAWVLTGMHPRGADPRSLYSTSGETQVALTLREEEGSAIQLRRSVSNLSEPRGGQIETALWVDTTQEVLRGSEAETWILNRLMPAAGGRDPAAQSATLLHCYYMQQESLREFLSSRSDDERFTALSRMVGAGSLSDLAKDFDVAKTAWTRATNRADQDLGPLRTRVERLAEGLSELSIQASVAQRTLPRSKWDDWWAHSSTVLERLGIASEQGLAPPPTPSGVGLSARVTALRQLVDILGRRREELEGMIGELAAGPSAGPTPEELRTLRANVADLDVQLTARTAAAEAVGREVADVQQQLRALRTEQDELAAMAGLAMRHLGPDCPVCEQPVDRVALEQRLRRLVDRRGRHVELPSLTTRLQALQAAEAGVAELETAKREADSALRRAEAEAVSASAIRASRQARLRALNVGLGGLGVNGDPADDATLTNQAMQMLAHLAFEAAEALALAAEGESFESFFRLEHTLARVNDERTELISLDASLKAAEGDLLRRRATGHRAELLLRALRSDAEAFVSARLTEIQPILNQLYAAIDPHPTFRSVRLATRLWYGKQRLDPVVADEDGKIEVDDPGRTLSTSQANALAVALFLAFNLGLMPARLESLVLDDPLQSLDDVHLLGLVDMLRRVLPYRQVIVTTHDAAFLSLLARKLRPLSTGQRVIVVDIKKWDSRGPSVQTYDVQADLNPMKIAAVG